MEFVKRLKASDGFECDVYMKPSPISGDPIYSAYAKDKEPNVGNRLFGSAYFPRIEDIVHVLG